MEVELLRNFVEIARSKSISITASRNHLTQSALSKRIVRLERELDVKLFTRVGNALETTEAGDSLLRDLPDILASLDDAFEKLERLKNQKKASLRIGYLAGAAEMLLPVIAKAFSKRAPLVELSLHAMEHTAMRGMLDAGELDACLTEIYTPPSASLQFTPIFKDYCVVATYDKYLKNKLILRPKHLDGQNILSGSSQSSYYAKLLRQVLQNHHVEVTIRPLFNNYTEIAARLQAESATTIIPAHLIASIPFGNAALIPFDCSELVHDFGILVHAKRMSPNLRTFVEVVRTEIPFRNYLLCSYPRLAAHADSASIQQSGLADSCGNILNC